MTKTVARGDYVVAMLKEQVGRDGPKLSVLDTGKRYSKLAAEKRAKELTETSSEELKYLDYDSFVAYNIGYKA